jgi:hypothetical protein
MGLFVTYHLKHNIRIATNVLSTTYFVLKQQKQKFKAKMFLMPFLGL